MFGSFQVVHSRTAGSRPQLAGASLEADTARSNELLDAQGGQLANLGKESTRSNEKAAATALTRAYVQLAQMLKGLPGRKQVVSGGWQMNSTLRITEPK